MRYHRSYLSIICLCIFVIISIIILIKLDNFYSQQFANFSLNSETFLLIVITSAGQNVQKRESIRNSWLKLTSEDTRHIFVIGDVDAKYTKNDLSDEQKKYNDIVFLSHTRDTYDSLTSKVLNAFVYSNQFLRFQFLLKCDDDSFVRPADIVHELRTNFIHIKNLYWGFFNGNAFVKRHGRWKENKWILCDRYLPYALGGGYVLSYSLVEFIARNQQYLIQFQTEDVSVGTWLAPVNVTRIHDPRFDTEYISRGCSNTYLITHKHNATNMKFFYQNIFSTGMLCDSEFKLRLSYLYNWDVEPSKCCKRRNASIP